MCDPFEPDLLKASPAWLNAELAACTMAVFKMAGEHRDPRLRQIATQHGLPSIMRDFGTTIVTGCAHEKMEVDYNSRMEASKGEESVANGEIENGRDMNGRPRTKKAKTDTNSVAAAANQSRPKKNHHNKYLEIRLPEGVNLEEMVHFCIRLLNVRRHYCKSRKAKNILVNAMQILDSTDDLDFVNKKYRTGIAQTVFFCGTYEDFCDQTRKEGRSVKGTQTIECRVSEPKPVATAEANVQTFLKRTLTKASQTAQCAENESRSKVRHADSSTQTDSSDDHTTSPQQQFPDSTNLNTVVNYINSYISPAKRMSRDRTADETAMTVDDEYAAFRKPSDNVPGILVTDPVGYPHISGRESSGIEDEAPPPPPPPPPPPEQRLSHDHDVSQVNRVVLEDPRLVVGRRSSLECPAVVNRRATDEAAIRDSRTIAVDPGKKGGSRSTSADGVTRPPLSVSPSVCPVIPLENPDLGSKPSDPRINVSDLAPPEKRAVSSSTITPKTKGSSRQAELAKKQKLKRKEKYQKKTCGEKSDNSSEPPSPPSIRKRTGPRTPPLPEKTQEKMVVETPKEAVDEEALEWTNEIVSRSTPKLPEEEVKDWNQSINSRSTARNPSPPRDSNPAALSFLDMRESRANEPSQKTIYCRLKTPYDVGDVPAATSFEKKFVSSPYSPTKADDEDSFSSEQAALTLPTVTTATTPKVQEDHTSISDELPMSYSPFSSGGLTNYANQSPESAVVVVPVPPVPAPVAMEEPRLAVVEKEKDKEKEKSRRKEEVDEDDYDDDDDDDDDDDETTESSESSESSETSESSSSSSDSPPEKDRLLSRKSSEKRKRAKEKKRREAEKRRLIEKYERKLAEKYKSRKPKYDKYDKYAKRSSDKYDKYEKKKSDKYNKKYEKVSYDKYEKKPSDKYDKKHEKKFFDKYEKKSSSDSHDRRSFEGYEKVYEKGYDKKALTDYYDKKIFSDNHDKKSTSDSHDRKSISDSHDKKTESHERKSLTDSHDKKTESHDRKSLTDNHDKKTESHDKKTESHDKKSDNNDKKALADSNEKKPQPDSHEKKSTTENQEKKADFQEKKLDFPVKKIDSQEKKVDPLDKKAITEGIEKKSAIEKLAEKVKLAEKEAEKVENLKKLAEKKKSNEMFERMTLTHPTRKISVKPPRKIHGETLPVKTAAIQVLAQKPLVDYPAENDPENTDDIVTSTATSNILQPAQSTTKIVRPKETIELTLAKSPSSFEPKFKNSFQPEDALPQRETVAEDVLVRSIVSFPDVPTAPPLPQEPAGGSSPPLPPQLPMYEPPLPEEVPTYTPPLPKDSPSHTPPLPPNKPPDSPSHTPPLPPPIYSTASGEVTSTTVTTLDANQMPVQNFPPFGFFQNQPPPIPNFAFPPPNVNDMPLTFSTPGTTFTPNSFSDVNSFSGTGGMMQPNMFAGMPNSFDMPFMGMPPPSMGVPPPSTTSGGDYSFNQSSFGPQPVPPPNSNSAGSFIGQALPITTSSGDLSYLTNQQSQSFIGPHRPTNSSADQSLFVNQAASTTTPTTSSSSSDMLYKSAALPCSTPADFATYMAAQTNNFGTLSSAKGLPQPVPPPSSTSVSGEFNFMGTPFQGQGAFNESLHQPSTNINNEFNNFMNVIQPQPNFGDTTAASFPQSMSAPQPVAAPSSFMGQLAPNFGQLGSFPLMTQGQPHLSYSATDKEGDFSFNEQMATSNDQHARDQTEAGQEQSTEMFFDANQQTFEGRNNFGREKRERRGRGMGNKRGGRGGNFTGPQGFFNSEAGPPGNFFQNNPQEGFFNQVRGPFFNQSGGSNAPPFYDGNQGNQPYRGKRGKFQGQNFSGNFRPPLIPPHGGPPRGPPPRFGEGSLRRGRSRGGRFRGSGQGNFKTRHAGPADLNTSAGGQGDLTRQPFESPNSEIVSYPSSFKYNKNNGPSPNRLTLLGENGILEPFAPTERGGHAKKIPEPRY